MYIRIFICDNGTMQNISLSLKKKKKKFKNETKIIPKIERI